MVWAKSNNNNNNNSGNNNDGGKYYSSARQQQRAAATNNNNDNYYNAGVDETATQAPVNLVTTQDFCKRHFVQVTQLSILCDTPGAYYSGSTAYRDSPICVGGDKAKLNVTCTYSLYTYMYVYNAVTEQKLDLLLLLLFEATFIVVSSGVF